MSEDTLSTKERNEDMLKAFNLLAQGKRNMICKEYDTAVNQYQEACELLAKWYGEMGKELAEPYFRYGSALLELARAESGVFGSAMPGMEDEDNEEEDEAESSEDHGEKTSDENEAENGRDSTEVGSKSEKNEMEMRAKGPAGDRQAPEGGDMEKTEKQVESMPAAEVESQADAPMETDADNPAQDEKRNGAGQERIPGDGEASEEGSAKQRKTKQTPKAEREGAGKAGREELAAEAGVDTSAGSRRCQPDGESATTKENSADESASQEGSPSAEEKEKMEEKKEKMEEKKEKMEEKKEEKEEEKTEEGTKKEQANTDDAQAGCSKDENGEGEGEEEDDSNLKLAWEMVELAKVIFLRSETKEDQLKAAECFIKLGEIELESDTIDGAIQDFQSSLDIQLRHEEPHSRILAETYYQLGMSYGLAGDPEKSAANYSHAAKTIEAKMVSLEKMTEGAASDKGKAPAALDDPVANAQDELKELKELLPDIVAKVEEAEAEAKSTRETVRKLAAMASALKAGGDASFAGFGSSSSSGFGSSSSSQPQASGTSQATSSGASNITHLVRKKRKQEGEDNDSGVEVKRTRSENGMGESADSSTQKQQEQGSGDSAATTEKQVTPAPVAAVSGESA